MLTKEEPVCSKTPWTEIVEAKRAIRSRHIKNHQDKIGNSRIDTEITQTPDISALTQLLESKRVSVEDIVTAYIQRYV
jgi:ribonuclease HI